MSVIAIEFDFVTRQQRNVSCEQAQCAIDAGKSCWVDVDLSDNADVTATLRSFGIGEILSVAALGKNSVGRYDVYDNFLHITLAAPLLQQGRVGFESIDLIIAERVLFTLHLGDSTVMQRVHQNYAKFLQTFAQSLGFLLFETWDSLIDTHRRVFAEIEERVEQTRNSIFQAGNDEIFGSVAELSADLLYLRKNVMAVRETLDQIATHKSAFVPETTQPYLRNMVGSLDRLAGDLTVEREILTESLTLHLGIVSHRTNRLLHRLTLVSVIFMPLMFLCGVYGMNFPLPEFGWRYGYAYFWAMVVLVVIAMVAVTRVRKMW